MGTDPTAEELAAAAQAGSKDGFTRLVERFEGPLYNFVLLRIGDAGEAEELVQETFLRAWSRIGSYRPRWRFATWLFTIARRLAASHHRVRRPRPTSGAALDALTTGGGDPSSALDDREERSRVWDLAKRVLTEDQRSALWLRYAEDLSVQEIAEVLGRRTSTVRVLMFRARARLAEHLEPERVAGSSAPAATVPELRWSPQRIPEA
ncbi:MAG: sigma-70 family RNA polymerase sigma factor [Planctomycetota bacterium]|nr:sigma-70 family RNA polymerase sigma factor [Planctomycetota bacterium]